MASFDCFYRLALIRGDEWEASFYAMIGENVGVPRENIVRGIVDQRRNTAVMATSAMVKD
jgi:hypothetical protein